MTLIAALATPWHFSAVSVSTQGFDCTALMMQGWTTEYCAVSTDCEKVGLACKLYFAHVHNARGASFDHVLHQSFVLFVFLLDIELLVVSSLLRFVVGRASFVSYAS